MGKPRIESDPDVEPVPRWVKVFGIVAAALVVAFIVVHLLGGGLVHHVPAEHTPAHGAARHDH